MNLINKFLGLIKRKDEQPRLIEQSPESRDEWFRRVTTFNRKPKQLPKQYPLPPDLLGFEESDFF